MAKVIKLKNRTGEMVLPLTRSQLVQVSAITGLNLASGKEWTKASVQDALEALYSYASTNNAGYDKDIQDIKNALEGVLDATGAVVNYVDAQDTAYLALAYAEAAAKATEAQTNSYAEAAAKATAAENAAKEYADGKFLSKVKLNNSFVTVESDETNGRYVDLGAIATDESLQALTNKVNAIEAAYITKTASEEADEAIVTAYEAADSAIIAAYTQADTAIITAYQAADTAIITAYQAADTALSNRIGALESSYEVTMTATDGTGAGSYLKRYTITQGSETIGTIDIPRDLLATSGELKYGSLSGDTFTENASGDPYIKMTVGNGVDTQAFYIPVKGLVEYNQFTSSSEVVFTDTDHNVTAYVGSIAATKVTYAETTVDAAIADLYSQIGEGGSVAAQITEAISYLDASYTASGTAAHSGTYVMNAVTQTDGKITSIGSVEVEAAGAAAAVKDELKGTATTYTNLGLVETEIGAIRTAINGLDDAAVKTVNGQSPDTNGAVKVNANQIDTVNTYKLKNDSSAATHKVDEVLAEAVLFEELSPSTNYDDVTLTV